MSSPAIDPLKVLPSELRALRGALGDVRTVLDIERDLGAVDAAVRTAGPDDVIVCGLGADGEDAKPVSRATWLSWTGREAPPRKGGAVPVLSAWSTVPIDVAAHAPEVLDAKAKQALIGYVVPGALEAAQGRAFGALASAVKECAAPPPPPPPASSAKRWADHTPEELLALRQRDERAFDALLRASAKEAPPRPAPSARWEDLTTEQKIELRAKSPAVFERLLEDFRARKAGAP